MTDIVASARQGDVVVITLNNPPVNALSALLRAGLLGVIREAEDDPATSGLVITGTGRGFCGGADIREFDAAPVIPAPALLDLIAHIEDFPKPVVAAIHGMALGGGLELALSCHYRVGLMSASLGQPEIKLGMTPGAGATQRLPRLIGVEPALDLILTGDPITGQEAFSLGLLDKVVAERLVEAAVDFIDEVAATSQPMRKTRELEVELGESDDPEALFDRYRTSIERKARGLIAPGLCIDAVENALRMPFDVAMAAERAMFVVSRDSEQSKAQRHVFFAERQARKIPGLSPDLAAPSIESAAVIGCGTMGSGIAMSFANAGIPVRVVESSPELLERGLAKVRDAFQTRLAKGRITADEFETRMSLIVGTLDHEDIVTADIAIEAVFEDIDLKRQVFTTLDLVCKPDAILATNTSTLDVDEIARITNRPDKVIGTHFFSPAHVMKLMENVRGVDTSDETIAAVMKLSRTLGKVGVLVGVCDGFVGNRMLRAYTRQANFLLEEGALPQQVDRVMYDFGFPMGPFAMGDLAGLDVGWRIRQQQALRRPSTERYSPIADRICEQGRFGQKTGAGWYRYEEGSRTPIPDPEIEELIVEASRELGFERRRIDDSEILERCLYPLINEGAKILEEGIASRPGDIDVIWIYGYGFPVFRGGPMFYADRVGLGTVHATMSRLHAAQGEIQEPAPLLERLAGTGTGFYDA